MDYNGKLYGRLGKDAYFPLHNTTEDWDEMERKIADLLSRLPDNELNLFVKWQESKQLLVSQSKEIAELKEALKDFLIFWEILKNNGIDIDDLDQKMNIEYINKIRQLLK